VALPVLILALPLAVVGGWWGIADGEQLWRASSWLAGVVAVAALVALACADARTARICSSAAVAALCGTLTLLAVRGASQVLSEHPATVAHYDANRASVLASQGWAGGSPQALAYERRLRQREATGWFGFSNVYASIAASGAVLLAGVALVRAGQRRAPLSGTVALMLVALVAVSGSKGGIAAIAVGFGAAACAMTLSGRASGATMMRAVLLAAPLCALALPWVRWQAGGLEWGERSLLVRAGYLQSAWEAVLASPLFGWGPAGFQLADITFRPPWSVEEVSSAHAAIADWLAALGAPAGLALVAAMMLLAWRVPLALSPALARPDLQAQSDDARSAARTAMVAVAVAWLMGVGCELPALDPVGVLVRLLALAAALWVVRQAATAATHPQQVALGACAVGAVAALLAHGQIDMAFWLPASAPMAWIMIGSCAALGCARSAPDEPVLESPLRARHGAAERMPWPMRLMRATFASLGIGLLIAGGSLARQDYVMVRAAEDIATAGGDAPSRARAAQQLLQAWIIEPARSPIAVAATNQALAAMRALPSDASRDDIDRVRAVVHDVHEAAGIAGELNASAFAAAQARARLAVAAARRQWMGWSAALESCEHAVALDPRSVGSWITLAEAREGARDPRGAADAIDRALEADASYALDPVRQMGDARRRAWESKAQALRGE
jgi:O-antigen ligase